MNVCTMGYSLVFTDWAYWERHIDWCVLLLRLLLLLLLR